MLISDAGHAFHDRPKAVRSIAGTVPSATAPEEMHE